MYRLLHWGFSEYQDAILAWGYVFGHDRLPDNKYIHTSKIQKMVCRKEQVLLVTLSGSYYELRWEEMNLNELKNTYDIWKRHYPAVTFPFDWRKLEEKIQQKRKAEAAEILSENELLLVMVEVSAFYAYLKNSQGQVRQIPIDIHVGTFQDSYLVTDWKKREVDFRYFDKLFGIKPYHWSDGLQGLKIKNVGTSEITFYGSERMILCKAGEVTCIKKKEYSGEGLFSPDVVNGKCAFFDPSKFDPSKEN